MEFLTEWEIKGRDEGQREIVVRLLQRKFGALPEALLTRIEPLPSVQLVPLGEALLDFTSLADLVAWLDAQPPVDPEVVLEDAWDDDALDEAAPEA